MNRGTLTLTTMRIEDSESNNQGGGVYNDAGATLTVTSSTITLSRATSNGGGGGIYNGGTLTLNSSTVSGNTSTGDGGGGIRNIGTGAISNSTISGNQTTGPSGFGGGIRSLAGTVTDSDVNDQRQHFGAVRRRHPPWQQHRRDIQHSQPYQRHHQRQHDGSGGDPELDRRHAQPH